MEARLASARAGGSFAVVVCGEPGIGKSTLLERLVVSATGFQVARAVGVEGEVDLAYAGLHQLCRALLDAIASLPEPQAQALRIAFGLESGPSPDRYLVGLAVLTLMSEVAAAQPLLWVVDDAQWLDRSTTQALAFVARRLGADSVGLVLASRETVAELDGVEELRLGGLAPADAASVLDSVLVGVQLDPRVRHRLLAETNGNPLALVELPRALTPADEYGGALVAHSSVSSRVESSFTRRLEQLPDDTRLLMLIAAAEPVGDPVLLRRAAVHLGLGGEAADAAEDAGLLVIREQCAFRHPLVRSAAYRAATARDRRAAHGALAHVTDGEVDPDRRAWHRAHAAAEPDEEIAAELDSAAARARARGGLAAAGAFLERAALLTPEPVKRASRMLAAAEVLFEAGAYVSASDLLQALEKAWLSEPDAARALRLEGMVVSHHEGPSRQSAYALCAAAERLMSHDPLLARLTQFEASRIAHRLRDRDLRSTVARSLAEPSPLGGESIVERVALAPAEAPHDGARLRDAARALCAKPQLEESDLLYTDLERGTLTLWDFDTWEQLIRRAMDFARERGSIVEYRGALSRWVEVKCAAGEFSAAESANAEQMAITAATGRVTNNAYDSVLLAVWRQPEAQALHLVRAMELRNLPSADWDYGAALLFNAEGRYSDALAAAQRSCDVHIYGVFSRVLPELVEAAVRNGDRERAEVALDQLKAHTRLSAAAWGCGVEARSTALLTEDAAVAEHLYQEAIELLTTARTRPDLARAHLLYGEWLRRENRRTDARDELRKAYDLLAEMGATLFEDRARRQLRGIGETARKRVDSTRDDLTAQETQIAQLAAEGLTNSEIAGKLFLSVRTIEWHLRHIYPKLGITSRRGLRAALP